MPVLTARSRLNVQGDVAAEYRPVALPEDCTLEPFTTIWPVPGNDVLGSGIATLFLTWILPALIVSCPVSPELSPVRFRTLSDPLELLLVLVRPLLPVRLPEMATGMPLE